MPAKAAKPAGARRALSIGVGQFRDASLELSYAPGRAAELRAELGVLGYACGDPVATDWTSQSLGEQVRAAIRSASADDVLIVHVLSHGKVSDDTGKLYVVGSDGRPHDLADVEGWLTAVQDGQNPPLVLFVLDICEAGTAARLPWQGATADGTARAWVIAACAPQEQAFNGWLTQATTTVLRRLREGDLDIDPSVEFVPLPKVAQEIRAEVRRLATGDGDGLSQQVTGTQLDISVAPPSLPFFQNPAFAPRRSVALPPETDPALATFADGIREPTPTGQSTTGQSTTGQSTTGQSRPGTPADGTPAAGASRADQPPAPDGSSNWGSDQDPLPDDADLSAGHWQDRAAGYGPIPGSLDAGCFTGRLDQLNQLIPWVQGWAPGNGARTLSVVTGGPGVGKSALLGILVCAAHPALRNATRPLWTEARQTPPEIDQLTAVHARQRDLADVTACLARQLTKVLTPPGNPRSDVADDADVQAPDTSPPDADPAQHVPADPAGLVAALSAVGAGQPVPVIVLDALDESIGSETIIDELIFPLVAARRADGTLACRVLVGTRRDGFEHLLDAAAAQHGLIDLDEVDRGKLLDDLNGYVVKLLRTQPAYRTMAAVRGAFAEELASALARQPDGDRRWGEFLIAGLYTHSFLRATAAAPLTSADEAGNQGAACPRTLPAVLDLDLEARENASDLRQVLQIVALAKGDGMPASVIDRIRPRQPKFGAHTPTLRALSELGFYLRRANDEDGTTLYRVFHEGLADELRPPAGTTEDPEEILLRASLSAWEPAWSRQSAEEAILAALLSDLGPADARRWDLAEPYVLRHALDHAQAVLAQVRWVSAQFPGILTIDPEFLVHADASVIAALGRLDSGAGNWLLSTDTAALLHLSPGDVLRAIRALALAIAEQQEPGAAAFSPAGPSASRRAALALTAARFTLPAPGLAAALANPPAGSPESPLPWQPRWTSGFHLRSDLMSDLLWPRPPTGTGSRPWSASSLTVGVVNGEPVAVVGMVGGGISVHALADGRVIAEFATTVYSNGGTVAEAPRPVEAIGIEHGTETLVVAAGEAIGWVRLPAPPAAGAHEPKNRPLDLALLDQELHGLRFTALEATTLAGRTLAALTDAWDEVTIVDLANHQVLERLDPSDAFITMDVDGVTFCLFRQTARPVDSITPHDGVRVAVATSVAPYRRVSVTALNGQFFGEELSGHTADITTLATMVLDGHPVAVTASLDGTVRFWDVPTQREIERLDLPGPVQAAAPLGDHLAVLCCGEVIVYARHQPSHPHGDPATSTPP